MTGVEPGASVPSSWAGPASPMLRERWRRDRRTIVRLHHPDRGGNALTLQRELAANDAWYRDLERRPRVQGPVVLETTLARRASRTVWGVARTVRSHLPRHWPGRRRYIDL